MLCKCPECGGQISTTAESCPHCGYTTFISEIKKEKRPCSYCQGTGKATNGQNCECCDGGQITFFTAIDSRTGKSCPSDAADNLNELTKQVRYRCADLRAYERVKKEGSGCLFFLAFFGAATLVASAKCLGYF